MTQQYRLGKTHTAYCGNPDSQQNPLTVIYHTTAVVRATPSEITLNTGGWFSNTTKTRMNQASNQFCLGFRVFQKDFNWFVDYKGQTIPFSDDVLVFKRDPAEFLKQIGFKRFSFLQDFNSEYNSANPFESWEEVAENYEVVHVDAGTFVKEVV